MQENQGQKVRRHRKTVIKREMECPAGCVPDRVAHLGVITARHCPLSHYHALTQVARAWVRVCTYLKAWIMDRAARETPQSKQHTSDLWRPPALPSPSVSQGDISAIVKQRLHNHCCLPWCCCMLGDGCWLFIEPRALMCANTYTQKRRMTERTAICNGNRMKMMVQCFR